MLATATTIKFNSSSVMTTDLMFSILQKGNLNQRQISDILGVNHFPFEHQSFPKLPVGRWLTQEGGRTLYSTGTKKHMLCNWNQNSIS